MATTPTLTTLGDLFALPGWRPDLAGPRTRGSLTERGMRETLSPDAPIEAFTPEVGNVPVARYYTFDASALGGRLGAATLAEVLADPAQRAMLAVRDGAHGIEMFLDRAPEAADLPPAPIGVAILGPVDDAGTLGWWTWYVATPATLTLGCVEDYNPEAGTGKALDHPAASLAVKLHNGGAPTPDTDTTTDSAPASAGEEE